MLTEVKKLVDDLDAKLVSLVSGPGSLGDIFDSIEGLVDRLRDIDLGFLTTSLDELFADVRSKIEALDPAALAATLLEDFDAVLEQDRSRSPAAEGRPRRARHHLSRRHRQAEGARPGEDRHRRPRAGIREHDPSASLRVRPLARPRHAGEQAVEPEGRAEAGAREGQRGVEAHADRRARSGARRRRRCCLGGARRRLGRSGDRAVSVGSILIQPQRLPRVETAEDADTAFADLAALALGVLRDVLGGGHVLEQFEAAGVAEAERVLAHAESGTRPRTAAAREAGRGAGRTAAGARHRAGRDQPTPQRRSRRCTTCSPR